MHPAMSKSLLPDFAPELQARKMKLVRYLPYRTLFAILGDGEDRNMSKDIRYLICYLRNDQGGRPIYLPYLRVLAKLEDRVTDKGLLRIHSFRRRKPIDLFDMPNVLSLSTFIPFWPFGATTKCSMIYR